MLDYCGPHLRVAKIDEDGAAFDLFRIGDRIVSVDSCRGNDEMLMDALKRSRAFTQIGVERGISRERIDFTDPDSLDAHARWQDNALSTTPLDHTSTMEKEGVVHIPRVLSRETTSSLYDSVMRQLFSNQDEADKFSTGVFGATAGKGQEQTRWELRLKMDDQVQDVLDELFRKDCVLQSLVERAAGRDAELWELSVIVSAPGASPQIIHADTAYTPSPRLFTLFVALQDVSKDMGPTRFVPSTQDDPEAHSLFAEDAVAFLESQNGKTGEMLAGDATFYDSRLLHGGGANRSNKLRAQLCVTFKYDSLQGDKNYNMSPPSIRPELSGKFRLSSFTRKS